MSEAPPTLAELQALLATLVRRDRPLDVSATEEERAAAHAVIAGSERLDALGQLEIHREQYWLRHRDALREDLPALAYWLGREPFDALVRAYLDATPPSSFALRDLPLGLPAFLARYDALDRDVSEVARAIVRFEVALVTSFDAADAPALDVESVRSLPEDAWPRARLRFHPTLAVLDLTHPVHELRAALRRRESPVRELPPRATRLALWRGPDRRLHETELEPAEHALLAELVRDAPLEEACTRVAARACGSEAWDVARWFEAWTRRGWIVAVDV